MTWQSAPNFHAKSSALCLMIKLCRLQTGQREENNNHTCSSETLFNNIAIFHLLTLNSSWTEYASISAKIPINFDCFHPLTVSLICRRTFDTLQSPLVHNDCQIYLIFFDSRAVTTPRDKVLILKHLQLFPIIAFSSCCLTSSPHA